MSVYVDDAGIPWRGSRYYHLLADSVSELHELAEKIGLKRAWFQNKRSGVHYDVSERVRTRAVAAGAIQLDRMRDRELYKALIKQAKTQYVGREQ